MLKRWMIGSGIVAALGSSASAQIPANIEFRVPKPPTVAAGDSGAFLAYELVITNLVPGVVALRSIEVLDAGDTSRTLWSVQDSVLNRIVARPGVTTPPSERLQFAGGSRGLLYLWVPVNAGRAPAMLRHRLAFKRVAGGTQAGTAGAASSTDTSVFTISGSNTRVTPSAAAVQAPLRGEWLAANGPSNLSGHRRSALAIEGTVAIGQRFAIDFLQVDSSSRSWRPGTDSTDNRSYYAYGKEIHSVGEGTVVQVKDSIPENSPRSRVARAVPITLETVAGNHIVVDMGQGRFAFYAHVIPGTLRVKPGDRVRAGQVLGLVGNSGNSTEPHLHFHMSDGISPLGAEGTPYRLSSFDLVGRCELSASGIRCARSATTVVRNAMPLQNQLVRFPN